MAKTSKKILDDKNDPTLIPSDPEDEDFVASDVEGGSSSDSEAEHDHLGSEQRPAKRQKTEPSLDASQLDDLWASFNSDASATAAAGASQTKPVQKDKVKVTLKYEFAGETVLEEKEVEADSEAAKEFERSGRKPIPARAARKPAASSKPPPSAPATSSSNKFFEDEPSTAASTEASASNSNKHEDVVKPAPPANRPKARAGGGGGGLAAMAASLGKPAKLNTLEKSKMDWNKYVVKEDLGDQLSAARKDGYLDKQDFLKRAEEKREEEYDKAKSTRRR